MASVILSSSCKKVFIKYNVAENEQNTTLFDQIIAKSPDGNIPYPFSKLLAYLNKYAVPVPILIPVGRSQQRHDASFQDPRLIIGFRAFRGQPERKDGLSIHARLFLGYVEKSKQIEIMSLATGRESFDFQVIDNYAVNSKSVVRHANRNNCLSCHQHGGPIFTPRPWAETNFNNNVIVRLLAHFHTQGTVNGISLNQIFDRNAFDFELLVKNAASTLLDNKIWNTQCTGAERAVCRANMLINTLSLHGLVKPVDFMLLPNFEHPQDIMLDRNISIILPADSDEYLADYHLSAQAITIINKMVVEENKKYTVVKSPHTLFANYIRDEAAVESSTSKLFQWLPNLQEEERSILSREMANVIIHLHRKDMHKNTDYDPLTKRENDFKQPRPTFPYNNNKAKIWTLSRRGTLGELIERLRDKFVEQTLLTNNRSYWLRSVIRSVFINTINVEKSSDGIVFTPFFAQALLKTKTKDSATYVSADTVGTAYLALRELTVYVADKIYNKPKRVSKAVFDGRAGEYEFDLLCRTDPAEHVIYSCSAFDQWQIEAAIMTMLQDKSSPLYYDYLQPRVIISKVLATLGYNLSATQTIQQHNHDGSPQQQVLYVPDSQDEVGQKLYRHCGDCHANRDDEYDFLYVSSAQALCANIKHYINSAALQKSERDIIFALTSKFMPPADSTYTDEFTQAERTSLVNALKEDKLPFCQ